MSTEGSVQLHRGVSAARPRVGGRCMSTEGSVQLHRGVGAARPRVGACRQRGRGAAPPRGRVGAARLGVGAAPPRGQCSSTAAPPRGRCNSTGGRCSSKVPRGRCMSTEGSVQLHRGFSAARPKGERLVPLCRRHGFCVSFVFGGQRALNHTVNAAPDPSPCATQINTARLRGREHGATTP